MNTERTEELKPCPSIVTDALLEELIVAVLTHTEVGFPENAVPYELRMHKQAVKADMVEALNTRSLTPQAGEGVVAWKFELARAICPDRTYTDWGPPQLSFSEPCVPEGSIRNLEPLYARPTPSVATGEIVERLAREGAPASWVRYDELRRDGKPIPNDLCDLIAATLGTAKAAATLIEQQAATIAELQEPKTADDLRRIIQRWLDADDPTHWGEFEKTLDAALNGSQT